MLPNFHSCRMLCLGIAMIEENYADCTGSLLPHHAHGSYMLTIGMNKSPESRHARHSNPANKYPEALRLWESRPTRSKFAAVQSGNCGKGGDVAQGSGPMELAFVGIRDKSVASASFLLGSATSPKPTCYPCSAGAHASSLVGMLPCS